MEAQLRILLVNYFKEGANITLKLIDNLNKLEMEFKKSGDNINAIRTNETKKEITKSMVQTDRKIEQLTFKLR